MNDAIKCKDFLSVVAKATTSKEVRQICANATDEQISSLLELLINALDNESFIKTVIDSKRERSSLRKNLKNFIQLKNRKRISISRFRKLLMKSSAMLPSLVSFLLIKALEYLGENTFV